MRIIQQFQNQFENGTKQRICAVYHRGSVPTALGIMAQFAEKIGTYNGGTFSTSSNFLQYNDDGDTTQTVYLATVTAIFKKKSGDTPKYVSIVLDNCLSSDFVNTARAKLNTAYANCADKYECISANVIVNNSEV